MLEKDFQSKFTRWASYNHRSSAAFELKLTHTSSLQFDAVASHQLQSLLSVKRGSFVYKISDDSRGLKPFDCFSLSGEAYVVVMFYKRGQKEFFMIDVDQLVAESERSQRRSLTASRAAEIGTRCELA